jgi:hypothetical protein
METITQAGDFLNAIGLDAGVVIGVVFLSRAITFLIEGQVYRTSDSDENAKLRLKGRKRFYTLIPIGLSIIAAGSLAMIENEFDPALFVRYSLSYSGAASLIYNVVKKTIAGR